MSIQVAKVREFKGHTQAIYTLCAGGTTGHFYSSGADGMVVKWNADENDGELIVRFDHPVYSLFLSGTILLCGGNNGILSIIETSSKTVIRHIRFHEASIFDIVFYNNQFLLAHKNGVLSVIDRDYELVRDIKISGKSIRKILPVLEQIYLTGSEALIWELNAEFEIKNTIPAGNLTVFTLAFNKEKKILLSAGRDAVLKIWQGIEALKTINAHWYPINDIAYNEPQQYFATGSMDKSVKIWDANDYSLLKVIDFEKFEGHTSSVNKILWIGINRFISCSDDRTIMCFEILE